MSRVHIDMDGTMMSGNRRKMNEVRLKLEPLSFECGRDSLGGDME